MPMYLMSSGVMPIVFACADTRDVDDDIAMTTIAAATTAHTLARLIGIMSSSFRATGGFARHLNREPIRVVNAPGLLRSLRRVETTTVQFGFHLRMVVV